MPVMERERVVLPPELMSLPVVEYPPEVTESWDAEVEIVRAQIAIGQAEVYSNAKDLFRDIKRNNG